MAGIKNGNSPKFPFPSFLRRFIDMESSSGIMMIAAAVLALIAANSAFYPAYKEFITTPLSFGFGELYAVEPLKIWVKDILMVFFFFLVGLELKRETAEGFLSSKEQIILPFIAAIGGMLLPALIFLGVNHQALENWNGWAIPAATDIAFALCVLMLAGRGVPPAVKIFLLAIAIFDDLGAILVIAFFYSEELNLHALALAFAGIGVLYAFNRLKVSLITPYLVVGVYLWFCFYHSGIHTTVAGVITGLMMPMRCFHNPNHSPVNQSIHFLHPWVGFVILPIFAFTSAGIPLHGLSFNDLLEPLPLGITLALFFGKQIGIFGMCWLAIRLGFAKLPQNASWLHVYAVSIIAGIGFTMSLFIGMLAFPEAMQRQIKLGVIAGSFLSAMWGSAILSITRNYTPSGEKTNLEPSRK